MKRGVTAAECDGTIAERMAERRAASFVGRHAERELFEKMLDADESCRVLFVHGPAGVGKSSLLEAFARLAAAAKRPVTRIDGRTTPATAGGVKSAVDTVANRATLALLVDGYDLLEPLDDWFREDLIPGLPERSVIAIASRRPPPVAWRIDPAWRELLRVVSLRNLPPDDSRRFLLGAGVAAEQCARLLELTHGHPLALALVADIVGRGGDPGWSTLPRDVVASLVAQLLEDLPSVEHRRAIEVCAVARVTTESLLRDALDLEEARDLFDWLAQLPFVEPVPDGLAPHDLARDVVDVDLRWRDRTTYDAVFRRVRSHVHSRLRTQRGVEQQRAIFDEKFVFRNLPSVLSPVDWRSWGNAYPEPARVADRDAVLAMIADHEGTESAAIAATWWDQQPEAFHVVRHGAEVVGALVLLTLTEEPAFDPGATAAWRHAAHHAPPRAGEVVTQTRFVLDRDRYQAPSPTLNATPVLTMQRYLSTPNLAWDYLTLSEPEPYDDYFAIADLPRAVGADFTVAGRRYGLFAHDFRRVSVEEWLEVVTERALAQDVRPGSGGIDEPVVLSQLDFAAAVRRALRDLHRPDLLSRNPLCFSALVRTHAGADPAGTLAELIRGAAEVLRHDARDERRWRAIDRTYLRSAATQEQAAEVLGLPFSTYRRHLTEGVDRITERLWQFELYGSNPTST
jgi:hypothetical protein